jgi:peptidoglycan/LPS O-acetylase OafA/YrhL
MGLESFTVNAITALFLLPSPLSPMLYPFNGPAWSLFVELIANAAFGGVARVLTGPALLLIVASAGSALILCAAGPGILGGGTWEDLYIGLVRVGYSFFAGVLVYQVWLVRKPPALPVILIAAVMAAALVTSSYETATVLFVFPLLIWLGAASNPRQLTAACKWLGEASYAVYILHWPIYRLAAKIAIRLGAMPHDWRYAISFIVVVIVTADIAARLDARIRSRIWTARRGSVRQFSADAVIPHRSN